MTKSKGILSRVTPEQKRQFNWLTMDPAGPHISVAAACRQTGVSPATGYRLKTGAKQSPGVDSRKMQAELPAPRRLEELGTDAREALADFNLFGEMFFALRPSHWRRDAAMRIVDALADRANRTFLDMNLFPGAGKTTLGKCVVCWILSGGGLEDPIAGRGLRGMIGSEVQKTARHMLRNIRLPLELRRPFAMFDKETREWIEASHCLAVEYGRFKPDTMLGDESLWSQDQILVAQHGDVDLVLKEPTLQVASKESGFLGERIDFAIWDDLATTKNSRNPDMAEAMNTWFENEAETRVEKGGVMVLIGQRLSPLDLHRKRLDARVENEQTGELEPLYVHITYPAHRDELCDGEHRQWDPSGSGTGCLTDAAAMSVKDWTGVKSKQDYRTVYQQEDADPARILVQPAWLEGGLDSEGVLSPGSYDRDRGFWEWPAGVGQIIDYVAVDPSAGNWWVAEWWALQPESRHNYLIEGRRGKIQAGAFLDWDNRTQEFRGWMHEMQVGSIVAGHPIRVWIVEAVAAQKYLFQFEHYRRWKEQFPYVSVIPHQTQINKNDPELGVEGLLPGRYRTGMKHLPKKQGIENLNYLRVKERELTTYPFAQTYDTVMADWVGEWNVDKIITLGRRQVGESVRPDPGLKLPRYLERQSLEYVR